MSDEKEAKGFGIGAPEGAPDDFDPEEVEHAESGADMGAGRD